MMAAYLGCSSRLPSCRDLGEDGAAVSLEEMQWGSLLWPPGLSPTQVRAVAEGRGWVDDDRTEKDGGEVEGKQENASGRKKKG